MHKLLLPLSHCPPVCGVQQEEGGRFSGAAFSSLEQQKILLVLRIHIIPSSQYGMEDDAWNTIWRSGRFNFCPWWHINLCGLNLIICYLYRSQSNLSVTCLGRDNTCTQRQLKALYTAQWHQITEFPHDCTNQSAIIMMQKHLESRLAHFRISHPSQPHQMKIGTAKTSKYSTDMLSRARNYFIAQHFCYYCTE